MNKQIDFEIRCIWANIVCVFFNISFDNGTIFFHGAKKNSNVIIKFRSFFIFFRAKGDATSLFFNADLKIINTTNKFTQSYSLIKLKNSSQKLLLSKRASASCLTEIEQNNNWHWIYWKLFVCKSKYSMLINKFVTLYQRQKVTWSAIDFKRIHC